MKILIISTIIAFPIFFILKPLMHRYVDWCKRLEEDHDDIDPWP
ncbi:hypothetical protein IIO_06291 [Bacillus cereus VD115]|nr:hypothetical protein IIO_06291 [Bacillus cereus VD115]